MVTAGVSLHDSTRIISMPIKIINIVHTNENLKTYVLISMFIKRLLSRLLLITMENGKT